jgi:hypothetical protein
MLALSLGCHSLAFLRPKQAEMTAPVTTDDAPRLPSKYQVRVAPVLFLSDFELRPDLPLFHELGEMRGQIQKQLLLPPATDPVKVYLFETEQSYSAYMKSTREYKDLPDRRAFFVAQPRGLGEDLLVYTYWSKRIRQDLRHELTHALLHSVIKEVPQWLDEGLAEYFELRPELAGVNAEHVRRLQRDWSVPGNEPNLTKLEELTLIDDMHPQHYREAWAWVHLMLHSTPEARTELLSYLQQLRGSRHPGPFAPRVAKHFPDPAKALRGHIAALAFPAPGETVRAR